MLLRCFDFNMPHSLNYQALHDRYGERYKWFVMAVIALGTIGAVVLSTSFNVAVPALMSHFGVGHDAVQLAVTCFMVASTIAMLPTPWLIQRFGLRACFIAAVLLLIVSSVLGSFSPTFNLLLAARVAQGIAAGVIYPLGTFAVMRLFPPDQQGRASGLLGFSIVLAPAVSPALGGVLIDHFGWEAVFYISLPFCALAGVGAWRLMPVTEEGAQDNFDWTGMLLLSVMTMALLASVTHFQGDLLSEPVLLVALLLSVLTLLGFLWHATRSPRAIVSIALFAHPTLAMGLTISLIYGFGIYGSTYLIPLYLQTVMGLSATHSGAILVPGGIGLALSLPLAGVLSDRTSPRLVVLAGLLMLALSFAGMFIVAGQRSEAYFIELTVLGRVGSGLIIAALNQAAMQGIHGPLLGQAAMFIGYVRQLGGVLGVAVLAVFVDWRTLQLGGTPTAAATAFADGFLLSMLIFALATLAAWSMRLPMSRSDTL